MKVVVWSDFVCPFCYIGKRKIEKAINEFPHKDKIEVIYKAYKLNPEAPEEPQGKGYEAFASLKGVSLEQAKEMYDRVENMAKTMDLHFQMHQTLTVSTDKAHRLTKWAHQFKKDKSLTELLMEGYFVKGLNIANNDVLLDMVELLDLDRSEALKVLQSNDFEDEVQQDIDEARKVGVRGVPFFVFNDKYAVSGAQPDQVFKDALQQAYDEASPFEQIGSDSEEGLCGPDGCTF